MFFWGKIMFGPLVTMGFTDDLGFGISVFFLCKTEKKNDVISDLFLR